MADTAAPPTPTVKQASKRIAPIIEPLRVKPGSKVKLARDFDPAFKSGVKKKKEGAELLQEGVALLAEYQSRLAAQQTHGVVVVLQALDAAGKDGTIRHVMTGLNPQGVRVESFKVPSALELDQDFLRRYQERLPTRGEIGIFNRSHYEEVLVVRVHPENLVRQKLPPSRASITSGNAGTRRSTTGSTTSPTRAFGSSSSS
jgi:polyphosphate kinase 2 (PPK2 family)